MSKDGWDMASLIWMINSHLNRTALYLLAFWNPSSGLPDTTSDSSHVRRIALYVNFGIKNYFQPTSPIDSINFLVISLPVLHLFSQVTGGFKNAIARFSPRQLRCVMTQYFSAFLAHVEPPNQGRIMPLLHFYYWRTYFKEHFKAYFWIGCTYNLFAWVAWPKKGRYALKSCRARQLKELIWIKQKNICV